MPFVEQTNLGAALNFNVGYAEPANSTVLLTSVNFLLCPSDPTSVPAGSGGGTNYRSNEGTGVAMWHGVSDTAGVNKALAAPNGLFFANTASRIADVCDGLSNTAAFSEHIITAAKSSAPTNIEALLERNVTLGKRGTDPPLRCASVPFSPAPPERSS